MLFIHAVYNNMMAFSVGSELVWFIQSAPKVLVSVCCRDL